MTSPAPADGKFVTSDDVVARFEGTFPSGRVTWLKHRILDVENELLGEVPSLRTIDVASTDEVVKIRIGRVRSLVIEKVLELYRNPDGSASRSQTMDGFTESTVFSRDFTSKAALSFTEEELNRVRVRKRHRAKLGTFSVAPERISPC